MFIFLFHYPFIFHHFYHMGFGFFFFWGFSKVPKVDNSQM